MELASFEFLKYIYLLTQVNKLGNVKIRKLMNHFSSPENFYNCKINDLKRINGIDESISLEILSGIKNKEKYFREFDEIFSRAERSEIKLVCISDKDYPENLKRIFDTPVLLYYKGKLSETDKYSLSIVGTRNPTEYGKYNCEKFTDELSGLNIPIVSGFARGIDTIVHKTCIKNKRLNYAVFGCGADVIYPYENKRLYSEVIECGAVISEFPLGAKPDKVNFPRRNRIISGISVGTIVVESGIKGGALLTAEIAVDQDREVFAFPGNISSKQSEGTNELIKRGQAKLITNIDDILNELEVKLKPILKKDYTAKTDVLTLNLSESENKIYSVLDYDPVHIDTINELTDLTISDCLVNLLTLEFKSLVRQVPGKYFMRY
ncbi:MAG: DNA-protecting protein DprA [Ignavibacteria bacterium]|nr:DNA-protecting protein DprA [Ignavibacteria bacterium]